MEGDAIRSVQKGELSEAAELRWDGASEHHIIVEPPKRTIFERNFHRL